MFYPFAFTGICTGELCEIRDRRADFVNDDTELLSISCDSHGNAEGVLRGGGPRPPVAQRLLAARRGRPRLRGLLGEDRFRHPSHLRARSRWSHPLVGGQRPRRGPGRRRLRSRPCGTGLIRPPLSTGNSGIWGAAILEMRIRPIRCGLRLAASAGGPRPKRSRPFHVRGAALGRCSGLSSIGMADRTLVRARLVDLFHVRDDAADQCDLGRSLRLPHRLMGGGLADSSGWIIGRHVRGCRGNEIREWGQRRGR